MSNTSETPAKEEETPDKNLDEDTSDIDIDDQLQSFRVSPDPQPERQDQTPEKILIGGGQI